jgi:hypothetical protein
VDGSLEVELASGLERRVDVDERHLTREIARQRREHVCLVAEDQPVPPRTSGAVSFVDLVGVENDRGASREDADAALVLPFPDELRHGSQFVIADAGVGVAIVAGGVTQK